MLCCVCGAGEAPKEVTVEQYFYRQYNGLTLRDPWELLVCVDRQRNTMLPVEVLTLVQQQPRRPTPESVEEVRERAAVAPDERKTETLRLMRQSGLAGDPTLAAFGMRLQTGLDGQPQMLEVKARLLGAPHIKYGNHPVPTVLPDGSWLLRFGSHSQHTQFVQPVSVFSWALVVFFTPSQQQEQQLRMLEEMLVEKMRNLGIRLPESGNHPAQGGWAQRPGSWPARVAYRPELSEEEHMQEAIRAAQATFQVR